MFMCTKFKSYLISVVVRAQKAKEKYRGVFEIQRSGDKTSSGEIGLDIRTHASPKVGQDQVSGGVSVPCRHATPVADALWKPIFGDIRFSKMLSPVKLSHVGIMSNRYRVLPVSTSRTNARKLTSLETISNVS